MLLINLLILCLVHSTEIDGNKKLYWSAYADVSTCPTSESEIQYFDYFEVDECYNGDMYKCNDTHAWSIHHGDESCITEAVLGPVVDLIPCEVPSQSITGCSTIRDLLGELGVDMGDWAIGFMNYGTPGCLEIDYMSTHYFPQENLACVDGLSSIRYKLSYDREGIPPVEFERFDVIDTDCTDVVVENYMFNLSQCYETTTVMNAIDETAISFKFVALDTQAGGKMLMCGSLLVLFLMCLLI